jgi:hypothetical protein
MQTAAKNELEQSGQTIIYNKLRQQLQYKVQLISASTKAIKLKIKHEFLQKCKFPFTKKQN